MPAKTKKKSPYAILRAKRIAQGLCGVCGKRKIWKQHSSCECKNCFTYYRAWEQKNRMAQ
jgi:hypothetical protein